jgi:hypothetical protein
MKKRIIFMLMAGVLMSQATACSWSKDAVKNETEASSSASSEEMVKSESIPEERAASGSVSGESDAAEAVSAARTDSTETAESSLTADEMSMTGSSEKDEKAQLAEAFGKCVGWGGSSGSSLRSAAAATELVSWAADSTLDAEQTGETVKEALNQFDEEQLAGFRLNWRGIRMNGMLMFSDFSSVSGVLEDGGVLDAAKAAVEKPEAQKKWEDLMACIDDAL